MNEKPLRSLLAGAACLALSTPLNAVAREGQAALPENIAPKAEVSATSEYSDKYFARFAVDGKIPAPMSRDDLSRAWVVKGSTHGGGADFTLEWPRPVTVAAVVYYGRTGFDWNENWKACELHAGGATAAICKVPLKRGHGPQLIALPKPVVSKRLTLKFVGSHGGPNPGASEIQVYGEVPKLASLGKLTPPFSGHRPVAPLPEDSPELLARLKAGEAGFRKLLVVQRHHIRCSHVYTYHCEGQKNGGGLYIHDVTDGGLKQLVDSTNGQISGCDLSYDGEEILFSWRRDKLYQVYRIGVDGRGLTQLTDDFSHNYDACWLPDGDVAFLSTRRPQAAYCFFTPVGVIYRMKPDGGEQRCISANYLNDFTPAVMNDGRLIYGRWEYVDRPAIPIQSLWTINPDGTGLSVFFGNRVLDPASFIEPQAIPGSTKILCTLTGHNGSCRGAIGIIDPALGNNAQEAIGNLTPDVALRGVTISSNGPRGPYQTPYPVDDRYFLVSYDGTLLLRDYDGTEQCVALKPDGMGFYNPRPLRPRPCPPIVPSALPEEPEPDGWATLFLRDVYRGLEPDVKRGEVKQVAVIEELPRVLIDSKGIRRPAFDFQRIVVSCGATYVPKKVWGVVDVDDDGSAMFRVPARKPLYFMALDAEGRAVQRMRSFTHLMPGEAQGCVGCHEPRRQTARLTALPTATRREAAKPVPPEWGLKGFCYATIVQPVLDKHCVKCHRPGGCTPKGLDLTGDKTDYFNVSYETLARGRRVLRRRPGNEVSLDNPYTSWIPTYNGQEKNILQITPRTWGSPASKLTELVLTGHRDLAGLPRISLSREERRRVLTWIDLNVPYYGTADTAYPDNQACRRQYPAKLDAVLADVARRRCVSCHTPRKDNKGRVIDPGIPRKQWTRITNPHFNSFLRAPLAEEAGGTQACGEAVFKSKDDPDYRAILKTFDPVLEDLKRTPRMDMADALLGRGNG